MDVVLFLRQAAHLQSMELERTEDLRCLPSSSRARLWRAQGDRAGNQKFAPSRLRFAYHVIQFQSSGENIEMSPNAQSLKLLLVALLALLAGSNGSATHLFAADSSSAVHCAALAYRQFDFWVGDWDVFDVDSPAKVAHAQVDLILDGCVLREDYQSKDGHKGQSFSIYDASRDVWHQTWVTDRGVLLVIEGKFEGGKMILSGQNPAKGALVRGEWKPENGNVRESAVTSTDGGQTWKPWFDLVFRPH